MGNRVPPSIMTQMLIRKPVEEVFNAFIDPEITTKFWFTKCIGKIETGKEILWEWEMYGVSTKVFVKVANKNEQIIIDWGEPPTTVELKFIPKSATTALVQISNWGFTGKEDEIMAKAIDSMGGFSFLLAGLKALLEHNVILSLVADHQPDANILKL